MPIKDKMEKKIKRPLLEVKSSSKDANANILQALKETKIRSEHLEIQFKMYRYFFEQFAYDNWSRV